MLDIATVPDDTPIAGGTCAPPDGALHPCAADCDHQGCHAGWFARKARPDGLVYCCSREGWVTPLPRRSSTPGTRTAAIATTDSQSGLRPRPRARSTGVAQPVGAGELIAGAASTIPGRLAGAPGSAASAASS